jgi:hypothetical protein
LHRSEDIDLDQKWRNTHNTWASSIEKFYKWFAYPNLPSRERKKLPRDKWPQQLRQLQRVDTNKLSYITSKDVWRDFDNLYFYKYCTHKLRLKFYHALAMDVTARPSDLLQLKIKDIEIKKDVKGVFYAP